VRRWIITLFRSESGITSVEYALLLSMIGATTAAAALLLSMAVESRIDGTADELND